MESQRPGERQGFPHVTGSLLTDRGMPALHRSPLARFLVPGAVGRLGEDGSIGRPEAPIGFRDGFPKPPTGGFASVSHDAGHDLSRPSGPSAPQNSQDVPPRPAARSRLPEDERRLPDRPDGDPIQPRPSPQADPLRIGPQNRLLRRLRIPPLGLQDPIGPTGLAGVLRVPVPIPSVPASAAPVSPSLWNPGTPPREDSLCDTPLTQRSSPLLSWVTGRYHPPSSSQLLRAWTTRSSITSPQCSIKPGYRMHDARYKMQDALRSGHELGQEERG